MCALCSHFEYSNSKGHTAVCPYRLDFSSPRETVLKDKASAANRAASDKLERLMSLIIETFVVGPLPNNLYLLRDDIAREIVVVDPSMNSDAAINRVLELQRDGYKLSAIWNTHGHFDHIYDNARWKSHFDVPLLMHRDDEWLLETLPDTSAMFGFDEPQIAQPDSWIEAGQTLSVGAHACRVLDVPGHSPGSVAFYFSDDNVCISGDVLFRNSAGRTDLPRCDIEILRHSLSRLCELPDATRILPGHMEETTIGEEKKSNPYCRNLPII